MVEPRTKLSITLAGKYQQMLTEGAEREKDKPTTYARKCIEWFLDGSNGSQEEPAKTTTDNNEPETLSLSVGQNHRLERMARFQKLIPSDMMDDIFNLVEYHLNSTSTGNIELIVSENTNADDEE